MIPRMSADKLRNRPPRSLQVTQFIFATVLLLRVVTLVRLSNSALMLHSGADMRFYDEWAQRIAHGRLTDHLAFYGLPLYAYLLAGIYALFGTGLFLPALLQAAVDATTAALIYKIAAGIFPAHAGSVTRAGREGVNKVALAAAAGWAFFIPAETYALILMPTTWFVCAFWFVIWLLIKNEQAPSATLSIAYGAFIGVVATGVATILFLIPLIVTAIIQKPWNPRSTLPPLRGRILSIILLLAGFVLGTAPCWLHNRFVAHDPVFLSTHGGINLWIGNNPVANGYPRFPTGIRAAQASMLQDSTAIAETAVGHPLKRSEVSAYWSAKAIGYIADHPGKWLRLLARKSLNFWNAFQYDDLSVISSFREGSVTLPGLRFALVAAFGVTGIAFALSRYRASRWIVAAMLLHMVAVLTVFITERYRLAIVPGLLIFSGFTVVEFYHSCLRHDWRALGASIVVLSGVTFLISQPRKDPSLWALDAYNSGWQALETGDLSRAENRLELARAYVPDNAETTFALGNVRLQQHNLPAAKAFYVATLSLDQNHKGALNNLGVLALDEGDPSTAVSCFRRVVAQEATSAKAHFMLAKALAAADDPTAARAESARAAELDPNQPEYKTLLDQLGNR